MTNVLAEPTQQNHNLKEGICQARKQSTQRHNQFSSARWIDIDTRSRLRQRVEKMKTAALLLSPLLLAATMVTAQAAPPHSHFAATPGNTSSAMPGQPGSAQSDSLRGWLSGSKGNYTLTDHQGKQYKVVGGAKPPFPKPVGFPARTIQQPVEALQPSRY